MASRYEILVRALLDVVRDWDREWGSHHPMDPGSDKVELRGVVPVDALRANTDFDRGGNTRAEHCFACRFVSHSPKHPYPHLDCPTHGILRHEPVQLPVEVTNSLHRDHSDRMAHIEGG